MQLITDQYRNLNQELHSSSDAYGTSGHYHLGTIIDIARTFQTQDILDYGCGKSTLANNLPFAIKQYDPAIPKYSALPKAADIVVCTDVLEHIEPVCLDEVLDHLKSLTRIACFVNVATRPAKKHLSDGRNAHLIQKPARWWLQQLWDRFEVISFNLSKGEFNAVLMAKSTN